VFVSPAPLVLGALAPLMLGALAPLMLGAPAPPVLVPPAPPAASVGLSQATAAKSNTPHSRSRFGIPAGVMPETEQIRAFM
jgi:hypothetical protein